MLKFQAVDAYSSVFSTVSEYRILRSKCCKNGARNYQQSVYSIHFTPKFTLQKSKSAREIPGYSSAYHKKEVTAPTPKNGHNKRARPLSASLLCDSTIFNYLSLRFRYYYSILCCVLPVSNMRTFVTRIYVFHGCIDVSVSEYLRDLLDFHSSV